MKARLEQYFDRLWPLNRSITGQGLRQSLDIIGELLPLRRTEVPSGRQVFDWTVPLEWEVNEAYIRTPDGRKIANFADSNLHLIGYSIPIRAQMSLEELKPHLHTLPDQPDAVPYLTAYYGNTWGFCLTEQEYQTLVPGRYEVVIDSVLREGGMSLADAVLEGQSAKEILISTYLCHPSMANNELSGPLVAAFLYEKLAAMPDRFYTYRFVFVPETIGTIAYLSENKEHFRQHLYGGLVATCVGDPGDFTYKTSRAGNTEMDAIVKHILWHFAKDRHSIVDFIPIGSDERQYCSPGFNFAVGSLMRTMYGRYPEYHTSKDNKAFISFAALEESIAMYERMVQALEINHRYLNLQPFCEPCLGARSLYPTIGLKEEKDVALRRRMYLLNYSDGHHSILDIADKLGCCIFELRDEVRLLVSHSLLGIAS